MDRNGWYQQQFQQQQQIKEQTTVSKQTTTSVLSRGDFENYGFSTNDADNFEKIEIGEPNETSDIFVSANWKKSSDNEEFEDANDSVIENLDFLQGYLLDDDVQQFEPRKKLKSDYETSYPVSLSNSQQQIKPSLNSSSSGGLTQKGAPPKRASYDVLSSFFRLYFQPNKTAVIPKAVIYNLYWRKMVPILTRNSTGAITTSNNINSTTTPLTKNALYRKMWSVFKDYSEDILSCEVDFKDCVKGLKLITSLDEINYPGFDKDVELLRQYFGNNNLFDFKIDELERDIPPETSQQQLTSSGTYPPYNYQQRPPTEPGQKSTLILRIERLEQVAQMLSTEITDLKNVIKKDMYELAARKRAARG